MTERSSLKKECSDTVSGSRRDFFRVAAGGLAGLSTPFTARLSARQSAPPGLGPRTFIQPPSPKWVKDLIIYEIATKGFTSPRGPESGTFDSLRSKLPYLQELGITGIWLTGYSLGDPHHFYNIWTQYAVIEPDKLDPSLGTEKQFKTLIDDCHRRGIKVFLDVITHGVMNQSSLIRKHPGWFRGGSWGMTDYDWYGGHTDLDNWWVRVYTDYVTKFGVDGFRLDVAIYRPDLWERIRHNATDAGREVAIFEENNAPIPGVTDFSQHQNDLTVSQTGALNEMLVQAMPGFYKRRFGKAGRYRVVIQYADDGSRADGAIGAEGTLRVHLDGITRDRVSRRQGDDQPDGIPDVQLTVEGVAPRPIENISVSDELRERWEMLRTRNGGRPLVTEGKPPSLQLYVATLGHGWPSVLLSCHDNGWQGFPLSKNPYVAQGSRALFGYSVLFTPMIPIFFSGEEFNATFRSIPWQSPDLYGGKEAGRGRWLYGCMLDWEELNNPEHRAMLEDVKRMIAVRKREADVLAVEPDDREPRLLAAECEHDVNVPVPYVRWNGRRAIMVAANRNVARTAHLKLRIPLKEMSLAGHASYAVTNLWPGGATKVYSQGQLVAGIPCNVRPDKTAGGGLSVLKIEPRS
ncbi:MAG TPA: alpha-amylase family glycosyl hydrolase [Terriglobia bacterium]|nr:alpha-amylase family glycosyl hydrolase [Terriglobia bacterium]